jgi:hypothetical protein
MTVRSHFAVVIAVLTGVAAIFEFALPGMPLVWEAGERWGESGLAMVLAGDVIKSNFLCRAHNNRLF